MILVKGERNGELFAAKRVGKCLVIGGAFAGRSDR